MRPHPLVLLCACCTLIASAFAQTELRCTACGEVLRGDYVEVDGRYFHSDHFVCDACSKRISGSYVPLNGRYYHAACYQERFVVTCSVCNKVILEDYRKDFWGNATHTSHAADTPSCDFCERYVVGVFAAGGVALPDGRRLCGLCAATSVTTTAKARELMAGAAAALRAHGIRVATDGIPLLLLNRDRMQVVAPSEEHRVFGFTDYTRVSDDLAASFNIDLLYGMPEIEMTSTLSHELMHVWLIRNGVDVDDRELVEGSCQFASYLVMSGVPTQLGAFVIYQIQTEANSVYGGGFRRVKGYVDANGVDAWLNALTSGARIETPANKQQ